jgi:hypothetical protein
MRHWHLLNRLSRSPDPRPWDRCVLAVEQLESRENPAPVVTTPGYFEQTNENTALTFGGEGSSFGISDSSNDGQQYSAQLSTDQGTINLDPVQAASFGLSVANNNTSTVTLTGNLGAINAFLGTGFTYNPTAEYSGEANVTVSVTDSATGETGSGSVLVAVQPVPVASVLTVNAPAEVWTQSAPYVVPSGTLAVSPLPDLDGSDSVTLSFALSAPDPSLFTLSAGGSVLSPTGPGIWQVSVNTPSDLTAVLDSLVLTPPAGFTGRVNLTVSGVTSDTATFPSLEESITNTSDFGPVELNVRFFVGGSVVLTPASGREGDTLDLGGRYVASDPDDLPGDTHTLTLSVPSGMLTVSASALVSGMTAVRSVAPDGSTTITLTGDLDAINTFLALPGNLLYSPADPEFSGVVPLTVALANQPGPFGDAPGPQPGGMGGPAVGMVQSPTAPGQFVGTTTLTFAPVARAVFPTVNDAVTNAGTPVPVFIGLAPPPTDPSDSILLVVDHLPAGASFNHGANLGGGQWALGLSDLPGLLFNPPPGQIGLFGMTVRAIVTDTATDGTTDTATESTAFLVAVVPALVLGPGPAAPAAPVPAAPVPTGPLLPPPFDPKLTPTAVQPPPAPTGSTAAAVGAAPTGPVSTVTDVVVVDAPVLLEAIAGTAPITQTAGTVESQLGRYPPGPGSLFAQPETPLPTYAGSERHPLPPVLPLDQTSPVAGFTESGGDSIALIDKLYRDGTVLAPGAGAPKAAVVGPVNVAPAPHPARAPAQPTAAGKPNGPAASAVAVATGAGSDLTVPPTESDSSDWSNRMAGLALAGAAAAWLWLSRGLDGRIVRAIRRFLSPTRRPTPTGTF